MATNNLVTKGHLEKRLTKLRKDVYKDVGGLIEKSVIPLLEKMSNDIEEIKGIVNYHERQIDRHEDKLIVHNHRLKKLEATSKA